VTEIGAGQQILPVGRGTWRLVHGRQTVESSNWSGVDSMTLGMAWVRHLGRTREFVVAVDSRLSGGRAWDCSPKLLMLPRSDCMLAFAGDSLDAYPLMLQIVNSINLHPRTLDRTIDIVHLKGHMARVWRSMRDFIHSLPRGQTVPDPYDVTFMFGGYSWREKDFRFWRMTSTGTTFTSENPKRWGPDYTTLRIHFFGDEPAVADAKKRLAKLMLERGKLPGGDFDMEPFEVLRDIIRSGVHNSVGGPPQMAKSYEHMNTVPFAIYWPDRASGHATVLGRPLMEYELPRWPIVDPDNILFAEPSAENATRARTDEGDNIDERLTPF